MTTTIERISATQLRPGQRVFVRPSEPGRWGPTEPDLARPSDLRSQAARDRHIQDTVVATYDTYPGEYKLVHVVLASGLFVDLMPQQMIALVPS